MKIYTCGTSAGTQPYAGSHHVCTAVETGNSLYFIDAGECGAYTAKLSGADLLKTRAVFITHPHMDHVGGLGNLLWFVRKMTTLKNSPGFAHDGIKVFVPNKDIYDATMLLLKNTEGDFRCPYTHTCGEVKTGQVYEDENIRLFAKPTSHLSEVEGKPRSYAFIMEAEGKTVVFSGDINLCDFDTVLPGKCDAFFVETGHHQIEDVCDEIKRLGKKINRLFFTHNGGYIMTDKPAAVVRAKNAFGENTDICSDGDVFTL